MFSARWGGTAPREAPIASSGALLAVQRMAELQPARAAIREARTPQTALWDARMQVRTSQSLQAQALRAARSVIRQAREDRTRLRSLTSKQVQAIREAREAIRAREAREAIWRAREALAAVEQQRQEPVMATQLAPPLQTPQTGQPWVDIGPPETTAAGVEELSFFQRNKTAVVVGGAIAGTLLVGYLAFGRGRR